MEIVVAQAPRDSYSNRARCSWCRLSAYAFQDIPQRHPDGDSLGTPLYVLVLVQRVMMAVPFPV